MDDTEEDCSRADWIFHARELSSYRVAFLCFCDKGIVWLLSQFVNHTHNLLGKREQHN